MAGEGRRVMDEAGSRKSYEQLVEDKDVMRLAIKRLNEELVFNIEELVKSEAEVEKLSEALEKIREHYTLDTFAGIVSQEALKGRGG